ncbi:MULTISPECIES: SPJ_0845 family protein [unclassified Streptococcus]|nr:MULTISPECIES: SPJ_0845 family protein [unclassified Streptococcus]MBF0786857.1 hypothetical protein [Streptococcus sp. 19428wC2_LYSM12]MCQ9212732.1 hypothetical protein [Streptococcus sp. B01]MCQ9214073.1 hypothetical protein [Streptococcus sp. O1]
MAITYKRKDDLEKMLEEFASFDVLETVDFPNPIAKKETPEKKVSEK